MVELFQSMNMEITYITIMKFNWVDSQSFV